MCIPFPIEAIEILFAAQEEVIGAFQMHGVVVVNPGSSRHGDIVWMQSYHQIRCVFGDLTLPAIVVPNRWSRIGRRRRSPGRSRSMCILSMWFAGRSDSCALQGWSGSRVSTQLPGFIRSVQTFPGTITASMTTHTCTITTTEGYRRTFYAYTRR